MKEKDMYLPFWVCILGIVFLILACVALVISFTDSIHMLVGVVAGAGIGVSAILCWKNQSARMIDSNSFVYTTMFGKEICYRFAEIQGIKVTKDSYTLIMATGKVHIEFCAVLSDRFADAINEVLVKQNCSSFV